MKTLYLMRHAKAEPGGGLSRDRERHLNNRGRAAATLVGEYMAAHDMIPQRVYCSDTTRTCETLALLLEHFPPNTPTEIRSDIYLAGPPALLKLVRKLPDTTASAMIVGHNPGIESLAHSFADTGRNRNALIELDQKFPTAALAVLHFEIGHWQEAGPGRGQMVDFVVPRDLAEAAKN